MSVSESQLAAVAAGHEPPGRHQSKKAAASGWIGSAPEYYDFFIYATAASLIFPLGHRDAVPVDRQAYDRIRAQELAGSELAEA